MPDVRGLTQTAARVRGRATDLVRARTADPHGAVAAALARTDLTALTDPPAYAAFVAEAWRDRALAVDQRTAVRGERDAAATRFDHLLDLVASRLPALPGPETVRVAQAADDVFALRTPWDHVGDSTDVGTHARISSSGAVALRLLATVVRTMRSRQVLEIGTAYGLSGLVIAATLDRATEPGHLLTVESMRPQHDVSAPLLARHHGDRVTALLGRSDEVLAGALPALGGPVDLLFHDGAHSREAYVSDFALVEPHLAPGAVVVFDDIAWEPPGATASVRTYDGWSEVRAHPRVRASAELQDEWGVLLLS